MTGFAIGAKVWLKTCLLCGKPGTVLRIERGKLVIHWRDLDFVGRHAPDSLVLVEQRVSNSAAAASPALALEQRMNVRDEEAACR